MSYLEFTVLIYLIISYSLERVNAETAMQISKSNSMINHINDTQSEIELFLSQNNLSGI